MNKIKTVLMKIINNDKLFDGVNLTILSVLLVIFIWPIWFTAIASVSDYFEVKSGAVILFPKGFHLDGYELVFNDERIWRGYTNSILYTVVGTVINLIMTICCAFPLSVRDFKPRKFFTYAFLVTMYFGGGLIPTYLVVRSLGLLDTIWAMMIPGALSFYNALIVRNYFMNSVPKELYEATFLDGGSLFQYLTKVLIPLSKPVLAVVALYYLIGHWNDYYTALIYLYDEKLLPLQSVVKRIVMSGLRDNESSLALEDPERFVELMKKTGNISYAVLMISVLPMLMIYPFIQKYFVKGAMIGSVKG